MTLLPFFSQLNQTDKEIVVAFENKRISEYSHDEILQKINSIIAKIHVYCGFEYNFEMVNASIDDLIQDLTRYFLTLTFEEVELAFKKGSKSEYGKYFGLNNVSYCQWLNGYMMSESRLKLRKQLSDAKNKPVVKPEPTEEEKKEIIKQGALNCFETFKSTEIIYDFGNVTYNYLEKIGVLNISIERKFEIKNIVALKLEDANKIKLKDPSCFAQRHQIKNEISEILSGKSETLKKECRHFALKEFFLNLLEMGEELNNLI